MNNWYQYIMLIHFSFIMKKCCIVWLSSYPSFLEESHCFTLTKCWYILGDSLVFKIIFTVSSPIKIIEMYHRTTNLWESLGQTRQEINLYLSYNVEEKKIFWIWYLQISNSSSSDVIAKLLISVSASLSNSCFRRRENETLVIKWRQSLTLCSNHYCLICLNFEFH